MFKEINIIPNVPKIVSDMIVTETTYQIKKIHTAYENYEEHGGREPKTYFEADILDI